MVIDTTLQLPAVFDIAHLGLAAATLLFFVLTIIGWSRNTNSKSQKESNSDRESSNAAAPNTTKPLVDKPSHLAQMDQVGALQLLSIFQNEGRLVDFIREDVAQFADEDIGAAARVVHSGLRKVFDEHFEVEAILAHEEGDTVKVETGFKPQEIQLLGRVAGEGPYQGTLVHQGWRVKNTRLPKVVEGRDSRILAPAQVEIA